MNKDMKCIKKNLNKKIDDLTNFSIFEKLTIFITLAALIIKVFNLIDGLLDSINRD